jgi:hypothetical protein
MYEYRCDERLRPQTEGSTRLTYTGLFGGLEHLNIETKLNERFESVEIQNRDTLYFGLFIALCFFFLFFSLCLGLLSYICR